MCGSIFRLQLQWFGWPNKNWLCLNIVNIYAKAKKKDVSVFSKLGWSSTLLIFSWYFWLLRFCLLSFQVSSQNANKNVDMQGFIQPMQKYLYCLRLQYIHVCVCVCFSVHYQKKCCKQIDKHCSDLHIFFSTWYFDLPDMLRLNMNNAQRIIMDPLVETS